MSIERFGDIGCVVDWLYGRYRSRDRLDDFTFSDCPSLYRLAMKLRMKELAEVVSWSFQEEVNVRATRAIDLVLTEEEESVVRAVFEETSGNERALRDPLVQLVVHRLVAGGAWKHQDALQKLLSSHAVFAAEVMVELAKGCGA